MTTYAEIDAFADRIGARRRQAAETAQPFLLALGSPAPADRAPDSVPPVPAGATVALLATALDDLGQAEEELRAQNEALFAAHTELAEEQQAVLDLFELAPVAYVVTTVDGRLLRVNRAAFALFGRPANMTVGKPIAVLTARADRAGFRAALVRAASSPHVESWRVRLVPSDGEALECRVRVRAVRVVGGAPAGPVLYWVITPELSDPIDDLA